MKICYIASTVEVPYRTGLGSGGSTHTVEVAKTFAEMGDQVFILCRKSCAEQATNELFQGIAIRRLFDWNTTVYRMIKNRRFLWRVARLPYYGLRSIIHALRILRLARKETFDVIYERSSRSSLAGTAAALILRIPLVLEVNDQHWQSLSVRIAKKIVTPEKSVMARSMQDKVVALEWAVNTEMFHPFVDAQPIRHKYGITMRRVVVFVGSGLPWHGLREIVAAAPIVLEQCRDVIFLIVGGGSEISEWQRVVQERGWGKWFQFTGPIGYESVPAYVAAAEIALAPYNSGLAKEQRHQFASPLKVLEYMASGKALIVTKVGNVRQTVKDGINGLVISEDSPHALAEAIILLLNDSKLREMLGQQARAVAEENFSWRRHCVVLRELFAEAANLSSQEKAAIPFEAKA